MINIYYLVDTNSVLSSKFKRKVNLEKIVSAAVKGKLLITKYIKMVHVTAMSSAQHIENALTKPSTTHCQEQVGLSSNIRAIKGLLWQRKHTFH